MTVFEKSRPEDRGEIIDFVNMVFSMAHNPHDFKKILPKVYADGAPFYGDATHFIDRTDGRVSACVAMLRVPMIVAGHPLTCGYIGTVSVHPYQRGHGSMRQLMAMAADEARRQGCAFMALGGQRQRYEYFGFSQGGSFAAYEINKSNVRHALKDADISGIKFKRVEESDANLISAIHAIYETQPVHGSRPLPTFLTACHSWVCELYAVMDGGKCVGGFTANEKKEIKELLLASASDVSRVVKAWMAENGGEPVKLIVQAHSSELNRILGDFVEDLSLRAEHSINVLNWPDTLRSYASLKQSWRPMSDGQWTFSEDGGASITLTMRNGQADAAALGLEPDARFTHLEAQQAVFSQTSLLRTVPGAPVDWFPLPFGFPKMDMF